MLQEIPGHEKYLASETGEIFTSHKNGLKKMRLFTDPVTGYQRVAFYVGNYKYKTRYVHRVILTVFSGNPETGMQARHLNGIRTDNRLENLEWATPKINDSDKEIHGTRQHAEKNGMHKLTSQEALEISKSVSSSRSLARIYKVSKPTILSIKRGKTWHRVTGLKAG